MTVDASVAGDPSCVGAKTVRSVVRFVAGCTIAIALATAGCASAPPSASDLQAAAINAAKPRLLQQATTFNTKVEGFSAREISEDTFFGHLRSGSKALTAKAELDRIRAQGAPTYFTVFTTGPGDSAGEVDAAVTVRDGRINTSVE